MACARWTIFGIVENILTKDDEYTAMPFLQITTQTAPYLRIMEHLMGIMNTLIDLVMPTTWLRECGLASAVKYPNNTIFDIVTMTFKVGGTCSEPKWTYSIDACDMYLNLYVEAHSHVFFLFMQWSIFHLMI